MPTFTTALRLIQQAYASNPETWGEVLNQMLERIDEVMQPLEITVDGDVILTAQNALEDQARVMQLVFNGDGGFSVTAPAVPKFYKIVNNCAADVTILPEDGTGAVVRAGTSAWWFTDGAVAHVDDPTLDKVRQAVASVDLNAQKIVKLADPDDNQDAATKKYVDDQRNASEARPLDQLTAPTGPLSMAAQKIVDLATPTNANDAATFAFVHQQIAQAATINLPPVTGQAGKFLSNDGTTAEWEDPRASQGQAEAGADNDGFLTSLRGTQLINARRGAANGVASLGADTLVPLAQLQGVGIGQTWQVVSRALDTSYQNTTGKPIMVALRFASANTSLRSAQVDVSADNSTWVRAGAGASTNSSVDGVSAIVPANHYYRFSSVAEQELNNLTFTELR